MPLYEYECDACRRRFEVIQKFSDELRTTCEECGGHLRKLVSSPAIQFKGSGWYITDYAKKSARAESKGGADTKDATASTSKESGDSPAGDSKAAKDSTASTAAKKD